MRLSIDVLLDYLIDGAADVMLQIEAAAMPDQRLTTQDLTVWSDTPVVAVAGEEGIGQRCMIHGTGGFIARYQAVVEIDRVPVNIASLSATPPRQMPGDVLRYLLPSRYCESDRFEGFVDAGFGGLTGGALAVAMNDWVGQNLRYEAGTSSGVTTAMMTFADRRGVCRDFAHLLCALGRAGGIPSRCVSAYAPGVTPQDFHAVVEMWIDGRWHLLDPTGMADQTDLVRVAVGRDATDVAFMTAFGRCQLNRQEVMVRTV